MLDWLLPPGGDIAWERPTWHSARNPYAENVDFQDRRDPLDPLESPATRDQKARVAPEE